MTDFNDRGRPVKRKREDWAGPGLGHRDNDKMSKAVEPSQQPLKDMAPPLPKEALSKDEKVASIGAAVESFCPPIRELEQRLEDDKPVLAEQDARLLADYRRLCDLYLQVAHARLVDENTQLNCRCRDEEARLCHFWEVIQKMRDSVIDMVEMCENFKMTEGPAAGVAVIVPVVHVQEDQGTSASH
ncbi:uncharacterized protein BO88DRAFT_427257 [Aspergillus vadensis CBS 113365]|uniref:Uncharacterized protein n=1 Tax=Aspergillus vadensis (strain CBS 113365 / IMI 142717 / IBT 24658) TaxID=1448311 RepID=A0A319B2V3_ASPVC|nr:hypothetical protein BO88DRAFT_427257 [Aspergillus vadensis CBS 113365]PYH67076.1 hypothetical protein BO88DRAFT_427257 [Aspergillus vadensis CBS 113365]